LSGISSPFSSAGTSGASRSSNEYGQDLHHGDNRFGHAHPSESIHVPAELVKLSSKPDKSIGAERWQVALRNSDLSVYVSAQAALALDAADAEAVAQRKPSIHGAPVFAHVDKASVGTFTFRDTHTLGDAAYELDTAEFESRAGEKLVGLLGARSAGVPAHLPPELKVEVLSGVPQSSMTALRLVNREWCGLVSAYGIRTLTLRDFSQFTSFLNVENPTLSAGRKELRLHDPASNPREKWLTDARLRKLVEFIDKKYPQIDAIAFSGCKRVGEHLLGRLHPVQGLESLTVKNSDLTDQGLVCLLSGGGAARAFSGLKVLQMESNPIGDLTPLGHLLTLERLSLLYCPSINSLASLRNLQKLVSLQVPVHEFGHLAVRDLGEMDGLTSLNMTPFRLDGAQLLIALNNKNALKSLAIFAAQNMGDAVIQKIASLQNLKTLALTHCTFSASALVHLDACAHRIETFDIGLPGPDCLLPDLRSFSNVRDLTMEMCPRSTDHHLACLRDLSKLERLSLCRSGLTDAQLTQYVSPLSGRLRTLNLNDTQVTSQCVQALCDMKLTQLSVSGTLLSFADESRLKEAGIDLVLHA
jgi:hypothetical protein